MARKVNGRERTIGTDVWDVLTESDDLSGTRTREKLLIAVGTTVKIIRAPSEKERTRAITGACQDEE